MPEEFNWYTTPCKRCSTMSAHNYCHDCQMQGYDPSCSNYNKKKDKH